MAGQDSPIAVVRNQLTKMRGELQKALPPHVSVDKFERVAMTAIQSDQNLLEADRGSLFAAATKCAADGLVPDGREAVLTTFGGKVQYMPMMAGILKKVRNSGELLDITAYEVKEGDDFDHWIDESGEHIKFRPSYAGDGVTRLVFAVAKMKEGGIYVEVMSRTQIEAVRSVSRAKDSGPWKSWWGEMAKKTVIRRLAKRLPMSTDMEIVTREDDHYDFAEPPQPATPPVSAPALSRPTRLASIAPDRAPARDQGYIDAEPAGVSDDDIPI